MFKLGKFRKLNSPKPIRIKCLDCHSRHSLGEKRGRPDRVRETSGRGCQFSLKLGRARRSGGEVAWEQPRARRPGGAGDPAGCGRTPLPLRHLGRFAPEPSALCCAFQLHPHPPPLCSFIEANLPAPRGIFSTQLENSMKQFFKDWKLLF